MTPKKISPRRLIQLPAEMRKALSQFRQEFKTRFEDQLKNKQVARAAAQALSNSLRTHAKRGRKPRRDVSTALQIMNDPQWAHIPRPKRWRIAYRSSIPRWNQLTPDRRSVAQILLRERAKARENTLKRRAKQKEQNQGRSSSLPVS